MTTYDEEMTGLKGELSVIESEIKKLETALRPLVDRRKEINNRIAAMEEEGDDLAAIVGILDKYSTEEIEAALNRKMYAKKFVAYNK